MYVYLDVETGGLDPNENPILSICAMTEEGQAFYAQVAAEGRPCTKEALKVNGFREEELENGQPPAEVAEGFSDWLKGLSEGHIYDLIVAGWNVGFDIKFVESQLCRFVGVYVHYETVDVKALNRFLWEQGKSPVHGALSTVARALGVSDEDSHTSWGDVRMTREIHEVLRGLV